MKRLPQQKSRRCFIVFWFIFLSSISVVFRDCIILSLPGMFDRLLLISPCSDHSIQESAHTMNIIQNQTHTCACTLFQYIVETCMLDTWKNFKLKYKRLRCHLRMGKVYLPKRWLWHHVYITKFSIHSSSDTCLFIDMSQEWRDLEMASPTGVLRNTLQTKVLSSPSSNTPPPPIIEIDQLSIHWHSWKYPVIDVNASNVMVHVIVGSSLDDHTSTRVQGLHGPLNLPFILLGNSTIPEVLQAIPQPPVKEGMYPRMGIVNITNVNITVFGYPTKVTTTDHATVETMGNIRIETQPHTSKVLTQLWSINIPDEVFIPLLYATLDAGPMGIDQLQMSSVIIKSVGLGYWNHIIQEQKRANGLMYNSIEAVETWFTMIREKINQGGQVLDTHVDRITSAFEQGILNDENNPLGIILMEWKQKWDDFFFNFEIQGRKFLEENIIINDWAELWDGLGRNIPQGWGKFHRKYLSAKT